jgi:hypothetical protein
MSTPKPGQIRCPTCHGSTPPAAFCTNCGAPIPASARMRPRGLDRDELEERLRTRRPGDAPYRRGAPIDEPQYASPQPFQPEPEDELARPVVSGTPTPRNVDNLPPNYEAPPWEPASEEPRYEETGYDAAANDEPPYDERAYQPPRYDEPEPTRPQEALRPQEPARYDEPPAYAEPPAYNEPAAYAERPAYSETPRREPQPRHEPPPATLDDDEYLDEYDYPYDYPAYDEPRRSGNGPLMFIGFGALGLAALLAGVLLSGLFGPGKGTAQQSPSATPTATVAAEATPTPAASEPGGSQAPGASDGPPVAFEDGFTADVQPCAEEPDSPNGCDSSGAQVASGDPLWVWVGFTKGTSDDVLGITLVNAESGESVADASYQLAKLQADGTFNGWLKFSFTGLAPGSYTIRINRNGTPAAEAPFTVS